MQSMPVWMEKFVSSPHSVIGSKHVHYDFLRSGSGVGVGVKHQVLLMFWLKDRIYVIFSGEGAGVKHQVLLIRWLKHQVFFWGVVGRGVNYRAWCMCLGFDVLPKVWARSDALHPLPRTTPKCHLDLALLVTLDLTFWLQKTYLFLNKCLVLNVGGDSELFFSYKQSKCHQFVFCQWGEFSLDVILDLQKYIQRFVSVFSKHICWAVFTNVTEWYLWEVCEFFHKIEAYFGWFSIWFWSLCFHWKFFYNRKASSLCTT